MQIRKDIQKASQSLKDLEKSFMKSKIHLIYRNSNKTAWCGVENYNKDFEWITKIDLCTCRSCLQLLIDNCNRELDNLPKIVTQEVAEIAVEVTNILNQAIIQKNKIEHERRRSNFGNTL
jgi:hypothetical protein